MATKTEKKGDKEKTAKKKSEGRNSTPKLTSCPFVANLTRPHSPESSGNLATKLAEFASVKENWISEVRKAFSEGVKKADLPKFPVKAYVDPNKGQFSRKAYETLMDEYNEAVEAGTKTPVLYGRYDPVLVDLIHLQNCQSFRRGSVKKHPKPPKDWDEKALGSWYHEWEDEDGETVKEASGWFTDKKLPRPCHARFAESLIEDVDENVLTFGNCRYVVGTGTHDGSSVFMVNQTSRGNYLAGDITRKRMSLAGVKEVRNIVFKIEDRPNNGGGFTVKGKWANVRQMVYLPGQVLTAGFLSDSKGNQLDAKVIRALDADTKGIRFKSLESPIIGKAIPWSKLWADIKITNKAAIKAMRRRGGRSEEYEAGTIETKAITNICVNGKRVDPGEAFPFGLRGSQCNMVAYIVATGEGKIEDGHFSMGVILGERSNTEYNVGVHEAKAAKATKAAKIEASKSKDNDKPKAKSQRKTTPPKTASKASQTPKADKPGDEAPPVESDTEVEIEEAQSDIVEGMEAVEVAEEVEAVEAVEVAEEVEVAEVTAE